MSYYPAQCSCPSAFVVTHSLAVMKRFMARVESQMGWGRLVMPGFAFTSSPSPLCEGHRNLSNMNCLAKVSLHSKESAKWEKRECSEEKARYEQRMSCEKNATENTNPAWKKALERNMQINTPDRTEHSCVTLKSSTEVLKYSIMSSRVNESHLPTDFCQALNLLCCM